MTAPHYDDLKALFINSTLKRSPERSNTEGLIEVSTRIRRIWSRPERRELA